MKLKPIRTKKEHKEALEELMKLWDSKHNTPNGNRCEIISLLVQSYEDKHFKIDVPDSVSAIKFRMEQQNLKQVDLIPYIGSKSRVSEILNGKRTLSIAMIKRLNKGLEIPLESLID